MCGNGYNHFYKLIHKNRHNPHKSKQMKSAKVKTFLQQVHSGQLKKDKHRIFSYIRENPECIEREISKQLSIPLQTVSARCSDLKDLGVIVSLSQRKTDSGTHEVLTPEEQPGNIVRNQILRRQEKYKNWLKKAEQFHEFLSPGLKSHIEESKLSRYSA